ncbi:H(2):CoB-CoM heterodisulfide,ferredoxin reductase subunit C [Candidatus Lokiarchaeum ossiferum]|uniref:H(2):CoB-CoM heterodisulfide,ferredoxin reductase subunit C n=1 Tax=Candidatus Lokiarchaeum ossiferum TaxID=2951803 RepID=A0ABY6HVM6_9ARCH|nr:H(2):CoB-CoM heterodisulfide,ferredoxin reductase subunit C [Candidatus Lokiarchaeum sp. B-35]
MEYLKKDIIQSYRGSIEEEIIKDHALKAINACFQCGTCSGGCPSGRRTALVTRKIIRKAISNMEDVLNDKEIWMCTTCYTCFERCPRSVPITDIIIKLRNLAVRKGNMLESHKQLSHVLIQTGHGVPLGNADNQWAKLRMSCGLSPLPPTTHMHPEAIEEIAILVKKTHFDKLVGYPRIITTD